MLIRKVTTEDGPTTDSDEVVPVTVEPRPGRSDEEVAKRLRDVGAGDVTIMAPGFISAAVRRKSLDDIELVAYIHRKARKQPRTKSY